jgi:hypothetical protein
VSAGVSAGVGVNGTGADADTSAGAGTSAGTDTSADADAGTGAGADIIIRKLLSLIIKRFIVYKIKNIHFDDSKKVKIIIMI